MHERELRLLKEEVSKLRHLPEQRRELSEAVTRLKEQMHKTRDFDRQMIELAETLGDLLDRSIRYAVW
jgi:predicted transcriptional regulator